MKLKSYTVSYTNADDGDGWVISNEEYKTTRHFDRRMQLRSTQQYTYLVIDDLKAWDSGVFYIQDDQANLAVKVTLEVAGEWPPTSCLSGGPTVRALLTHRLDITLTRMSSRRLALFNCQSTFTLCKKSQIIKIIIVK